MIRALLVLPLVAACSAPVALPTAGPVEARQVTLYRDTVTTRMSDGALCTAVREGSGGPWQSTLRGCGHAWPVEVRTPTDRPRLPLVPVGEAPWVVLTAPAGQQGFAPPG